MAEKSTDVGSHCHGFCFEDVVTGIAEGANASFIFHLEERARSVRNSLGGEKHLPECESNDLVCRIAGRL